MPLNLKAWLFHSNFFCFCIPVRAGFLLISVLTFLLSGAISIIIWFEITHARQFSTNERVAFLLAGIVETLLFLVSTIGFIGVVARKQLFVAIYAYFLYVHFVINIIVGIYFLVTVRASNRQQLIDYCAEVFADTSVESSCAGLMNVSTYVFIAIVAALLFLELYGILVVTRYMYRLRTQKRDNRSRRLGYFHALSEPETVGRRHTRQESDHIELLRSMDEPQDLDDVVLDIRAESFMPAPTTGRGFPPVPAPSRSLTPPDLLSDTSSGRRVRALPPRPVGNPPPAPTYNRAPEKAAYPRKLPNPPATRPPRGYEPWTPESEDERRSLYTAEVSTTTHSALIDHANYMGTVFSSPPPVPRFPQRSLR